MMQKSPSEHHHIRVSDYIFATKACIDNRKKLVKKQYLLHMSSQYGELWPTNCWDRFGSLGHPSKFQRVSHLGFVTVSTSVNGDEPNFARYLAISWASKLYIHFWGLLSPKEFCQVQDSLCVQHLHSPVLATLMHRGTLAVGMSQTLRWVQGMELRTFTPRYFLSSSIFSFFLA